MTSPSGDYPRKIGTGKGGGTVAKRNPPSAVNDYNAPRKVYQLKRTDYTTSDEVPAIEGGVRQPRKRLLYIDVAQNKKVPMPRGTGALGSQRFIIVMWLIALAMIFWDEWHQNQVLARPSRLWWTTLTYGILAVAGTFEALIPLANVMAAGFTLVLAYQYYSGQGQFTPSGGGGGGKK